MITVIMPCRRGGPVLPGAANKTGVVPATSKPSSEQVVVMILVIMMLVVMMLILVILRIISNCDCSVVVVKTEENHSKSSKILAIVKIML